MNNKMVISRFSYQNILQLTLGALCTLAFIGCSSVSKKDYREDFVTEIREDGSKMFNFSLIANSVEPTRSKKTPADRLQSGDNRQKRQKKTENVSRREQASRAEKLERLMYERLDVALNSNEYCRTGYIELAQNIDTKIASIRGECNESANEADHKRF